jgi:hypothetical protein
MPSPVNTFYLVEKGSAPVAWNVHDDPPPAWPDDCRYFGAALREVDRRLGDRGLRFYMIWDLDLIPERGDDVVVLMVGDERYQVPRCAGQVLAVFKTGGLVPFRPYAGRSVSPLLRALDDARSLRDAVVRWRRKEDRRALAEGVFAVPLGYSRQVELPVRPLRPRAIDVFFAGGRGARPRIGQPRSWVPRPREVAREAMFDAIEQVQTLRPAAKCEFIAIGPGTPPLGPEAYSERLMNAKISLCPRGNFPETFRFFESARAGCAIVSEPLPDTWYYAGHPARIVSDWREAPRVIAQLLDSPAELEAMHARSLAWWAELASEQALGRYMAEAIAKLRDREAPLRSARHA